MKIKITVKRGTETVAEIHGLNRLDDAGKSLGGEVIRIEQTLEQLTGLRFHIETVEEEGK